MNLQNLTSVLVLLIGAMEAVSAQTAKWVDQINGNDRNDGNTEAAAYASLQFAIEHSSSGTATAPSLILVKNGVYSATGLMNPNGASTAILIQNLDYLTIQAVAGHYPSVKPTVAGVVSLSAANCNHLIIAGLVSDQTVARSDHWQIFNVTDLTVRHCAFEGGQRGIKFCAPLTMAVLERNMFKNITALSTGDALEFVAASCSGVTVQDNFFRDNTRQIRLHAQAGNTISDFVIRRNFMIGTPGEESIRLSGAQNVVIENNIVIYAAQQGLFLDADCRDIVIRHNTFYRNRYEAIRTQAAAPDIIVKNNIFYGNGTYAALAAPVSPLPGENYNLIFNTGSATETALQPAVTTFGANTKTGIDPLFVSARHGQENLYLQNNSPAIAMGVDLGVCDDIERFARQQSTPDVGAYENPQPIFAAPDVTVTPIAHHFGEVKIGASSLQTFVVSNTGNGDLQLKTSTITGANASEFAILSGIAPFRLAPGTSHHIVVGFHPNSVGVKSVALELVCDDPNKNSPIVRLSGIGGLPKPDEEEDHSSNLLPANFVLEQNYPNPFGNAAASPAFIEENHKTTIQFAVPAAAQVTLQIYDIRGALVKTLVSGMLAAGRHQIVWNGKNKNGQPVASGIYLYRIQAGNFLQTKRMLLVR
jgi:parallel beta-helix repeat protein